MATKIVLTGGSNTALSSALATVRRELESRGKKVFSPEDVAAFRRLDLRARMAQESAWEQAADNDEAALLLLPGGAAEDAREAGALGLTPVAARDRYDGVFCLADRTDADARVLDAWVGHPHLRILSADPESQVEEILALLGIPEPREIERRFLIRRPDDARLASLPACRSVEICQTYCRYPDGRRFRLRRRGEGSDVLYYHTEKTRLSDLTRIEIERRLTPEEYREELSCADPDRRPIRKTRTCLVWDGMYWELDRFPFWQKQAILEIELLREDQPFSLPPFVEVIREITGDKAYSNSALALAVPPEE